ncbi:MAG: hypothetical protein PF436_07630 [Prolixibacteraceae bacterium]|jgi:hypothetical protein|nr:hypothetical protein [Prolixibacteraceae bacterium]
MNPKENINFIFQLNNKDRSGNFFVLFILSGIVFLGLAFLFVATNKTYELIVTILLAVGFFIMFNKIKPSFFEMLVTERYLQVNFYSVSSTVRNYQSVEMNLHQLIGFKVNQSILGMKKTLILSVQSRYGIADYPPISVSILKKNEIEQVAHVLNRILENNKK